MTITKADTKVRDISKRHFPALDRYSRRITRNAIYEAFFSACTRNSTKQTSCFSELRYLCLRSLLFSLSDSNKWCQNMAPTWITNISSRCFQLQVTAAKSVLLHIIQRNMLKRDINLKILCTYHPLYAQYFSYTIAVLYIFLIYS